MNHSPAIQALIDKTISLDADLKSYEEITKMDGYKKNKVVSKAIETLKKEIKDIQMSSLLLRYG